MKITFNGFTGILHGYLYMKDQSICMKILDNDGSYVVCTVMLDGRKPPPGFVYIKDWSENEGLYDTLISYGVIDSALKEVGTGHTYAKLCQLTEYAKKYLYGNMLLRYEGDDVMNDISSLLDYQPEQIDGK